MFGAARQRFAAAQGAARARPARRTGLRDAPWLGASHVPRTRADALHGPVADPLTDHPARAIAAPWRDHLARDRRRSEHKVRAYLTPAHPPIASIGCHPSELSKGQLHPILRPLTLPPYL